MQHAARHDEDAAIVDAAALSVGVDDGVAFADVGFVDESEAGIVDRPALARQRRRQRAVGEILRQRAAAEQERAAEGDGDAAAAAHPVVGEGGIRHDRRTARLHEQAAAFRAGTCLRIVVDLHAAQAEGAAV